MRTVPLDDQRADREAAEWFAKLNTLSISTRALEDFQSWRRVPGNDAAYERMEALWQVGARLTNTPQTQAAVRAALARGARRRRLSLLWSPKTRTGYGIAALAAGALLALTFVIGQGEAYSTGVGEQRLVTLDDGTRLRLDTDTRLRVRFTGEGREIELRRGQAFFDVAHDPARPFIVEAADTSVRAIGTRFDVRKSGEAVKVTLVEGVVEVADRRGDRAWRLSPGEGIEATSHPAAKPAPVDVAAATSWTSGRLTFRATPLDEAVAEVNRYSRDKVVVDAARFERVPVSGVFDVGDTEAFVAAVSDLFELQADRERNQIMLRPRP
jgi:transmembrane sensor